MGEARRRKLMAPLTGRRFNAVVFMEEAQIAALAASPTGKALFLYAADPDEVTDDMRQVLISVRVPE